jgi:hypothetical protein
MNTKRTPKGLGENERFPEYLLKDTGVMINRNDTNKANKGIFDASNPVRIPYRVDR